ncbi:TetR/AcrR family transcriptional regulator [Streptomyces sp. RS10V-4]|uniref:TetR/AcrR family transcriptional regulator n=1 Tax=Streptomyces rhizoryzae TaxID=2932493 RepID=UPI002004A16D|nr:TetR/AcrR family transcriptional regulator [Streptomyces rhizoryzae]MCK7626749.1 TetR/AcrR family transcriptional regulator [Streptomyces rhizoryzae]
MPPPSPASAPQRRPRADAERNRGRVLDAARQVFRERGDEAQMPEIARAAGVGIGTVYRHFPSRAALIAAVGEQRQEEIVAFGRSRCLGCATAAEGLVAYLTHIGEVLSAERGLSAALEAAFGSTEPAGRGRAGAEEVAGRLLARGKDEGSVRADAEVADLVMAVCGLAAVIRTGAGDWRRYVRTVCAGLRP